MPLLCNLLNLATHYCSLQQIPTTTTMRRVKTSTYIFAMGRACITPQRRATNCCCWRILAIIPQSNSRKMSHAPLLMTIFTACGSLLLLLFIFIVVVAVHLHCCWRQGRGRVLLYCAVSTTRSRREVQMSWKMRRSVQVSQYLRSRVADSGRAQCIQKNNTLLSRQRKKESPLDVWTRLE